MAVAWKLMQWARLSPAQTLTITPQWPKFESLALRRVSRHELTSLECILIREVVAGEAGVSIQTVTNKPTTQASRNKVHSACTPKWILIKANLAGQLMFTKFKVRHKKPLTLNFSSTCLIYAKGSARVINTSLLKSRWTNCKGLCLASISREARGKIMTSKCIPCSFLASLTSKLLQVRKSKYQHSWTRLGADDAWHINDTDRSLG